MHKEEENVEKKGKDQTYISQKVKKRVREGKVRIQKNKNENTKLNTVLKQR